MEEIRAGTTLVGDNATMEFLVTRHESDGALHQMRVTYPPHSAPPPAHLHPAQDEEFQIVAGTVEFVLDGRTSTHAAPATVAVPAGTVHQLRNPGEEPATVLWTTRPALRTGEFFVAMHAALAAEDLEAVIAVVNEYDDVFCLADHPTERAELTQR